MLGCITPHFQSQSRLLVHTSHDYRSRTSEAGTTATYPDWVIAALLSGKFRICAHIDEATENISTVEDLLADCLAGK